MLLIWESDCLASICSISQKSTALLFLYAAHEDLWMAIHIIPNGQNDLVTPPFSQSFVIYLAQSIYPLRHTFEIVSCKPAWPGLAKFKKINEKSSKLQVFGLKSLNYCSETNEQAFWLIFVVIFVAKSRYLNLFI